LAITNFISQNKISDELKAEAKLYLSEICYLQKDYKESLDNAVDCLEVEVQKERWVHAYAYYFGAWSSFRLKRYIDAKLFLLQISTVDDFDFRNSLENKIYSLQRLLPVENHK